MFQALTFTFLERACNATQSTLPSNPKGPVVNVEGLKRDFQSPKSGGRVTASLVRPRGGPNGTPSLVAGLLTFPFVGEARAA